MSLRPCSPVVGPCVAKQVERAVKPAEQDDLVVHSVVCEAKVRPWRRRDRRSALAPSDAIVLPRVAEERALLDPTEQDDATTQRIVGELRAGPSRRRYGCGN